MKWHLFIASLLVACTCRPAQGSQRYVFEKGDVLTRPKLTDMFDVEHSGLYLNSNSVYRFTKEDALANALPERNPSDGFHAVIHGPGYGEYYDEVAGQWNTGIQIIGFQAFLSSKASEYRGAYESSNFNADRRHEVILAAGRQLGTPYTFFSNWKGTDNFRCDGFVRYVYSQPGVNAPFTEQTGSWLTNIPKDLRNQLTLAGGRAPVCTSASAIPNGSNFIMKTGNVKDDANGSGIDRVEFYYGSPSSGGDNRLATDDHDSNLDAGVSGTGLYSASSIFDPGAYIHTKVYDQAGNWAICTSTGQSIGTSDLTQTPPIINEDTVSPFLTNPTVAMNAGGTTATASWSSSDNQTSSNELQFAYAIDVPFYQWDDPLVTIQGKVPTTGRHEISFDVPNLVDGLHNFYLVGIDQEGNIGHTQMSFLIDRVAPGKPTNPIASGGDGKAMVTWTAPTHNADGSTPPNLAGYRVYYATSLDAEARLSNPEWESATTESILLQLPNRDKRKPYFVAVTALDAVGNESEFSVVVDVTPSADLWVHQTGGPSGSYPSISAALSEASDGATVLVGPGEYTEPELLVGGDEWGSMGFDPKNITLRSERGPGQTRIVGNTRIAVMDGCSVIGFTIAGSEGGIDCDFASDLLIANNIFISNMISVDSGGHVERAADRAVRIYNNVFVGNVSYGTGIKGFLDFGYVDVQNNIFRGVSINGTAISLEHSTNVVVKYNDFYGNKTDIVTRFEVPLVSDKFTWSPGFVSFNSTNPLAGDFHLVQHPVAGNGVDKGASRLQYKDVNWDRDCDGSDTDLGAYGGPFAYVDNNLHGDPGHGIPDCLEPVALPGGLVVLRNSTDQPVTLQARNPAGEVSYNVVTPPNGTLSGTAPNMAYTVTPDSLAPDTFSYTVTNEVGESAPAPVSIRVKETNHIPAAGDIALVQLANQIGEVLLQGTDEDGDALTFVIETNPDWVACLYPPTCYIQCKTTAGGMCSFSYHVNDGTADSASAMVTISVEPFFGFLTPNRSQTLLTNAASVTLSWADASSSGSVISLYAGGNLPENILAADILESDATNAFTWDISGWPDGDYPLSASVTDQWTTRWVEGGSVVIDHTPPQVSVDLEEGLYATGQSVSLTASETAAIHCTFDGSEPTPASWVYHGGVLVADTMTLKCLAVDQAGNVGPMVSKRYVIDNPPADIGLSASSIAENQAAGTLVCSLRTTDWDSGDTFTYGLVPGILDNSSFRIEDGAVQSAVSFDFEAGNSYSILLRSTDQDGLFAEKTFTITVTDVNDPPTLDAISNVTINEDPGVQSVSLSGITAGPGESQPLTVTATSSDIGLIPSPTVNYTSPNATGSLSFTPVANANGAATITVTVNDGQHSNNTMVRTFTVTVAPVNDPPTLGAVTPSALTSAPAAALTFSAVYRDADGNTNLNQAYLLVNTTPVAANGIKLLYDRTVNKLYLYNDAGTGYVDDCTPGLARNLSNTQGTLNCAATTITGSGKIMTINWNLTPNAAFASATARNLYLYARDISNATVGWTDKGNWTIKATNVSPTLGTVTPSARTSAPDVAKIFTAVYSDADGYANLKQAYFLVNSTKAAANGIKLLHDRTDNTLYLFDDAGTGYIGNCIPGVDGNLSNTQGTLNCAATTVTGSGTNLTVTWNITPSTSFASTTARNLYLYARDMSNATVGWTDMGDWTIDTLDGSLTPGGAILSTLGSTYCSWAAADETHQIACVGDTETLEACLLEAQANGLHDEIRLMRGLYRGNILFTQGEAFDLVISGGYGTDCAERSLDPAHTVLDGDVDGDGTGDGRVLTLDAGIETAHLQVERISVINGLVAPGDGGCLLLRTGGTAVVDGVVLAGCSAAGVGGAVLVDVGDGTARVRGSIIRGSNAELGGGLAVRGGRGGITLLNNTVSLNGAQVGGGISIQSDTPGALELTNNIIWGNSAAIGGDVDIVGYTDQAKVRLRGNDISAMDVPAAWPASDMTNINTDPGFVSEDDLHLRESSPCRDAGSRLRSALGSSDIDGDERVIGAGVDIGADEYDAGTR